jgi:hypothetical protein
MNEKLTETDPSLWGSSRAYVLRGRGGSNMIARSTLLAAVLLGLLLPASDGSADAITADHTVTGDFESIPASVIQEIKSDYHLFYGHTSHGSQIITGMDMIRDENLLYDFNNGAGTLSIEEYGSDLGQSGDTTWVSITRARLNQPGSNINMVVWSWCGGCSGNTVQGINTYLDAISRLELHYPGVEFVYMTGHLDGTGPSGNLYARNNQIRAYCTAHGKVLFDFADIESYDPDGTYYPNGADDCAWCSTWCASHPCPSCGGCAHSHCFNCYQKGKALWWLMAATLSDTTSSVADGDEGVLDRPRLAQSVPNPFESAATITFSLPAPAAVTLEVFNLRGELVATVAEGDMDAGEHAATWGGTGTAGRPLSSGIYFYRLRAGDSLDTRKAILLK